MSHEIYIQPGNDNATQREKERALCLLFTELSECVKNGCEVNIDDPRNIVVRAPKTAFMKLE